MNRPTPAELGYYMPAEWHLHAATWLDWPKDPQTWPDRVSQVQDIFIAMIAALSSGELVNLLVDDEDTRKQVEQRCNFRGFERIKFHLIETIDSWIRDYGPNFLLRNDGALAYNDWEFNAWGNKYPELKKDNRIPALLESVLQVPRFEPGLVLEGGSIDVNGAGCVLTTEQCLLNPNRNPHLSRAEIEGYLKSYLGVQKVLWLAEGIVGDDTDGHIDDVARFVSPTTIVCALEEDPVDPNYAPLRDGFRRLQKMTDLRGRPFDIVTLPMPSPVLGASTESRSLERLPASYANFYIANGVVLAPVFGGENDNRALEVLRRAFLNRFVIPVNCEPLVWGMGTIHCVTQQQPAIKSGMSNANNQLPHETREVSKR